MLLPNILASSLIILLHSWPYLMIFNIEHVKYSLTPPDLCRMRSIWNILAPPTSLDSIHIGPHTLPK